MGWKSIAVLPGSPSDTQDQGTATTAPCSAKKKGSSIPREAINDVLAKGNGDYAALRHA